MVNLTSDRIAAAHGLFSGIRQMAPVCTPPNIFILGPTPVQIPTGISIGSDVIAHLTAERPYTLQRAALSPRTCPFTLGDLDTHLLRGSSGQPESSIHTASLSVQSFLQGSLL